MKKITSSLVVLAASATMGVASLQAQKMYFGFSAGYGMPLAAQTLTSNEKGYGNGDHFHETVKGSFGKGMDFGILAGFQFNDHLGAELGIGYLLGGKTKRDYVKESSMHETMDMSAKMIRFVPSVRMTFGEGKLKPYTKIGMVIGVGGKITVNDQSADIGCNCGNDVNTWEYTGGISLGAAGAFGATYALNEKLSLFGELNFIAQSWAPKKGTMTIYTHDGTDLLPNFTTNMKEIDFVKSYTDNGLTTNTSEPSKQIRDYRSFSSVGISIGLHYTIGGGN